jgi:nitrate reductase cytochrome c-type subunit
MRLFITTITALLLFAAVPGSYAQQQRMPAEERAKKQTEWMKENMKLSTQQSDKLYKINLRFAKRADSIMIGMDPDAKRKGMTKLNMDRDAAIKAAVSPDQYKTYSDHVQQIKAAQHAQMQQGMQPGN